MSRRGKPLQLLTPRLSAAQLKQKRSACERKRTCGLQGLRRPQRRLLLIPRLLGLVQRQSRGLRPRVLRLSENPLQG